MTTWLEDLRRSLSTNEEIVLIGNKSDLETKREVERKEGKAFARAHGLVFMETSARTAANVDDVFIKMAKEIYAKVRDGVLVIKQEVCGLNFSIW